MNENEKRVGELREKIKSLDNQEKIYNLRIKMAKDRISGLDEQIKSLKDKIAHTDLEKEMASAELKTVRNRTIEIQGERAGIEKKVDETLKQIRKDWANEKA